MFGTHCNLAHSKYGDEIVQIFPDLEYLVFRFEPEIKFFSKIPFQRADWRTLTTLLESLEVDLVRPQLFLR